MRYFYASRYSDGVTVYSAECAAQPEGGSPVIQRWFADPVDALKAAAASGTLIQVVPS
jgi:hypothetical protein